MAGHVDKISKRTVDALEIPPKGKQNWLWDTELKGFFVRAFPTGRKVYGVKTRVNGRQIVHTIGTHGSPWNPDDARNHPDKGAKEAMRRAAAGENPNDEKKASREALTVGELIDVYLEQGPATKPAKRASTWAIDASNLNSHIRPLLGKRVANTLAKADAAKAIKDIADRKTATKAAPSGKARGRVFIQGGAGTARRVKITAAAMTNWAIAHGHIKIASGNPFASVKLAAAPVKERFLSREEAGRLLDAIADLEKAGRLSKTFGDAIRLLLLSGARKTEILGLRWAEVQVDRALLLLPPERTKAGGHSGERRITLSPPALSILAARRAAVDKAREEAAEKGEAFAEPIYVFPGAIGAGPATGVRRAFLKACQKAGLDGVRVHDLRHSYASLILADGGSLYLIAKLLGHASARTAERYSHLSNDPLQDAAALVGRRIMGGARPAAAVAELDAHATARA